MDAGWGGALSLENVYPLGHTNRYRGTALLVQMYNNINYTPGVIN